MKRISIKIQIVVVLFFTFIHVIPFASPTTGVPVITPRADAFISVAGENANTSANFGAEKVVEVGLGPNGSVIGLIRFDFSAFLSDAENAVFKSDIDAYNVTRAYLDVFISFGPIWNETNITGENNPFNAAELLGKRGNVTRIEIDALTDKIAFNLSQYMDYEGSVTLIFVMDTPYFQYIVMPSRERNFHTVEWPRIEYESPLYNSERIESGIMLAVVIGTIWVAYIVHVRRRSRSSRHL